jgi:hypothetical protein
VRWQKGKSGCEPPGIRHEEQEMEVVRQEHETANLDRVEALGSSQDTDDDLAELGAGREEHPAVNRPASHLNESSSFGYTA